MLHKVADMTRLYFMVLLVSGVNANPFCNSSGKVENEHVFYNGTEITIILNFSSVLCNWKDTQCYVECTTTSLTNILQTTSFNEYSFSDNRKIIVFYFGEKNVTCNVTKCVLDEIIALIETFSTSTNVNDLKKPIQIQSMCSNLFARPASTAIKNASIRAEVRYIVSLTSAPFNGTTKNYDLEQFSLTVVKMDSMGTTDLGHVKIAAPKVPGGNQTVDVFVPTEPFANVSKDQNNVGVVMYPSAKMFINDKSTVLASNVIRVETVGLHLKNLSNRLVINFTVNSVYMNRTPSCQFYDVNAVPGKEWSDMGSFTNLDNYNSSHIVTCSYDHMTPFAVLLTDMNQIDPQQWKILSYLTYVGCSLSAFFSTVTIFLYVFMKSSYKDNSIRIHVSLCMAVFLLNTSFLFIEWGASVTQEAVCVLIAVIIQYSLLACFSWMTVEALHLYLLLIKVFNTYIKRYVLKLSLFGWGVPAVLVGGSLCVFGSTPFYGRKVINLSDTNGTTQFCWITNTPFLYGMNISYFTLTFLFNTSVLALVTYQIFKLRHKNNKGKRLPSRKDICTVLGLTFLLGMTWGLIFLSSGYTNYPILYLFCICNSLQGLFLFLWFCSTVQKNRPLKEKKSSLSMTARGTESFYEKD